MLETRGATRGGLGRFAVTAALVWACLVLWALATPMFGAADENQQMITSYAVVHGQWPGQTDHTGARTYLVPSVFNRDGPCFLLAPQKPADCQVLDFGGPAHRVQSTTNSYPPFYYVAVGWPTLLGSGLFSLYLMRFVSALLVALMMALAFDTIGRARRRGPLVIGLAVGMVPAAFFFGASVNPSGLTIAAGLATWAGGVLLVRGDPLLLRSGVARAAGPLCVFLVLRRDSLYWAALILVAIVALTPWDRARRLARSRAAWAWAAAVGITAAVSFLLGGSDASSVTASAGGVGSFWGSVADIPDILRQLVGLLGWLDTALPFPAYAFVASIVALLVLGAWCFAAPRIAVVVAGLAVVVVAVPVAIGTLRYAYFQGRYEIGFAVGLPLVAALGITEQLDARHGSWPRRALALLLVMLAAVQVMAYAQTLRRFSAGAGGDWWIFTSPKWMPPHGSLTGLTVLFLIVNTALFVWLYQLGRTPSESPAPPPVADASSKVGLTT